MRSACQTIYEEVLHGQPCMTHPCSKHTSISSRVAALPLPQLWSLPPHPLHPHYAAQVAELATMEVSTQGAAAARLLDLGLVAALQQRLRVFGRGPLPPQFMPSASSPSPADSSGSQPSVLDAFCTALDKTLWILCEVLRVCHQSGRHSSSALQAVRQLLSDRFSLVAMVEKGLAPVVLHAAAGPLCLSAANVVTDVRGTFMLVSVILFKQETTVSGNKALARRLQQQLTTFLNLDAIRPHLEALCLVPLPAGGTSPSRPCDIAL
jgi:hypothetical protein